MRLPAIQLILVVTSLLVSGQLIAKTFLPANLEIFGFSLGRGPVSCDSKSRRSAEVVGNFWRYDEDAGIQMLGSLAPKDAKYTNTLGADFNQLEAKLDLEKGGTSCCRPSY